jgi:formylglycine-generating enzyme required for sulfatase activity
MEGPIQELLKRIDHLSDQFSELRDGIRRAVRVADDDPEMALIRARKVLEYVIRDVFERRVNEPPGTRPLENLVQRLVKDGYLPARLEAYTETIRKLGNLGAHRFGELVTAADVYQSLTQLLPILEWYFEAERPEAGVSLERPARAVQQPAQAGEQDGKRAPRAHVPVVPKGLRSFDAGDARFFLDLLPGPRDEQGLPESLRFWKHRIEARDEPTFTVGVIYGPSGCGKSSLVKAGLLPRLADHVVSVYVEATADETEARLLKGLRKRCPDLSGDLDLTGAIAALRRGEGLGRRQQVLVVLDQFEQWLHARRREQDPELARALRQCDGDRVQAIVMVRDDFWVALTRFMAELHIEIVQGRNAALVDLFDLIHARKVLAAFGKAYGRLPNDDGVLTRDQEGFLAQTIEGLAQDGRVVPIRLAVFAEMVKGRPWSPGTLKEVGGTQGVGVAFLEETFSSAALRKHQQAAQGVLRALLPESGTAIKGHLRSHDDLAAASGYGARPQELNHLLRTLDHEVRLITPTDPEGTETEGGEAPAPAGQFYQLTHDYLVPSIRDWLTRKQRETRRGRAELRLAERAALWNAKPENRHLPSVLEWANIRLLTKQREWTPPQRRMMRRAGRVHGVRALGLAIVIGLLTWGGIEGYGTLRAAALVESLKTASTTGVPALIEQLRPYRRWAGRPLVALLSSTETDSDPHLRASLASLALWPGDAREADYLLDRLLGASPVDLPVIWAILQRHHPGIDQRLWSVLDDPQADPEQRFRAACALANTGSAPVETRWDTLAPFVTERLLAAVIKNPGDYAPLIETLRPLRKPLLTPLSGIFRDPGRLESERSFATTILADYAAEEPNLLAELLMAAGPKAYGSLFPIAERQVVQILPLFQAEIAKTSTSGKGADSEQAKDTLAERQARATVALIRLGHAEEVWPLLRYSADPRLRSFLVNWLEPLGAAPKAVVRELDRLDSFSVRRGSPDPAGRPTEGLQSSTQSGDLRSPPWQGQETLPQQKAAPQRMDAILFHPETSTRRALILALGAYGMKGLSPGDREPLIGKLLDLYRNDPDAGIHGAAEWTLRQWDQEETIKTAEAELAQRKDKDRGNRRWYVNGQRQTFALIEGPVGFRMGSPPDEPDRSGDETLHQQPIPRRFAIATKEVTLAQYQEFTRKYRQFALSDGGIKQYGLEPDRPVIGVSWFIAAAYCNWLSEQEGIPKDQWCYLPNEKEEYDKGMTIPANALQRQGYRLPTEAEWEYACRAGTLTSRYYGNSLILLDRYAWYLKNSGDPPRMQPCGRVLPNDLGLFDMQGNVFEWCQDRYSDKPGGKKPSNDDIIDDDVRVLRGGSFYYRPALLRSAFRFRLEPANRLGGSGFRLAMTYN